MFDVQRRTSEADNFFAGSFPIATDFGPVASGATVRARTPVVKDENGIKEATAATLDNLVGISADEPSGGEVVYYLTGEFFTQGITLPDGVTAEKLKPALRRLGIFLKEVNING